MEVIPELVKDYRIEAWCGGVWTAIAEGHGNYMRKQVHVLEQPVTAERIRIVIEAANGAPHAELIEVRVYEEEQ